MDYDIDKIVSAACEVCGVDKEDVFCNSRREPLPLLRGFIWYTIRKITGYSNGHIAKITAMSGRQYTAAAVGIAINKAIELIYKEKFWRDCWDELSKKLDIPNNKKTNNDSIKVVLVVPKSLADKVKVEIKEQKLS